MDHTGRNAEMPPHDDDLIAAISSTIWLYDSLSISYPVRLNETRMLLLIRESTYQKLISSTTLIVLKIDSGRSKDVAAAVVRLKYPHANAIQWLQHRMYGVMELWHA